MGYLAKLNVFNQSWEVARADIVYHRDIDYRSGKPISELMGGYMHLTIPSSERDGILAQWMLHKDEATRCELTEGSLDFYKDAFDNPIAFNYEFQDAFLMYYWEGFSSQFEAPMLLHIVISPAIQRFRGQLHVKLWHVSPFPSKEVPVPQQATEVEVAAKVIKVEGPYNDAGELSEYVEPGKDYAYHATLNVDASTVDPKQVQWIYQLDDEEIKAAPNSTVKIVEGRLVKEITIGDEAWDNKKVTVFAYFEDNQGEGKSKADIKIARVYVTTSEGKYLFSLKPNNQHKPQVIKAKDLYSKGIQWFCPYADNYLSFLHKDKNLHTFTELKHFSWSEIVEFAEIERWMISYRSGGSGDWKASEKGGDGYILVTVGEFPYWGDAIGQIPFAVDLYTDNLEEGNSKENAIKNTIASGQKFGDGKTFGSSEDYSNSYDNHMILRACLWSTNRYRVEKDTEMMILSTDKVIRVEYTPQKLKETITQEQFEMYLK